MKKQLATLLLTLSLAAYAQKEVDLNKEGITYAQKGDLDKAFDLFNQAIAANPKFPNGYSNRGQVYRQQKKYNLAIADFSQSLALNPDNLDVLYARANVYLAMADFDKAIADYSSIISKKPSYPNIYFDRGFAYICEKKYAEAKIDMEEQLVLNPKDFKSLGNLINIKKKLNLKKEALADYEKLFAEFPNEKNLHVAYANRASLYVELNELDKALVDANKAIEINKDYDLGYLNRAEIYDKMGNKQKACADFAVAQKLNVELNKFFEADADYLSVKKACQ